MSLEQSYCHSEGSYYKFNIHKQLIRMHLCVSNFFFNLSTKCKPIGKLQISIYVVCWICSRCYFSESNKELHRPMTSDGIFRCLARMFFVCVLCVIIGQPRDLLYSLSYSLNVNTCGFTAISQLYSVFHIVVDWMAICWIDWNVNWYRHGSATFELTYNM